jgi:ribosomal protein S27AE
MTTRTTKATLQAQLDAAQAKLAKLEGKKAPKGKKGKKAKFVALNLTCPQCGREGYKTESGLADHLDRGWCGPKATKAKATKAKATKAKATKATTKATTKAPTDTPSGTKAPYPTPEQWLEWAKAKSTPKATTKLPEATQDVTQPLDTKDGIPCTGNADPVMAADGGITAKQLDLVSLQEAAQGTWGDDAILQFKATQHDARHARQLSDETWFTMDHEREARKADSRLLTEAFERIQALEAQMQHMPTASPEGWKRRVWEA